MDRQAKRKKNFLNTAKGYLPGIVVRQIQAIPQTVPCRLWSDSQPKAFAACSSL